jgi:hypothetical protein
LGTETQSFELKKKIGIWWPNDIYDVHFKEPLPQSKQQTRRSGNFQQVGVILPSSAGFIDGCSEVHQKSEWAAVKETCLYDQDTVTRDGQGADIWSFAQKKTTFKSKLAAKRVTENGPTALTLTSSAPGSGSKKTKADDGFDLFDDLWSLSAGLGETTDAGGEPCDEAGATPGKRAKRSGTRGGGGGGGGRAGGRHSSGGGKIGQRCGGKSSQRRQRCSTAAAAAAASTSSPAADAGFAFATTVTGARKAMEIANSEQVNLQGEQLIMAIQGPCTDSTVTEAAHKSIADK